MESQIPAQSRKPDDSVQRSQEEIKVATKFVKLLHRIASDEMEKYGQSRTFPFPFYVDEKFLTKLQQEIINHLSKVPISNEYEFKSETRFQDISTIRLDSFEMFINKAGDKKDPESTFLSWSKFAIDQNGEPIAGEVHISFVTEKRLKTQDVAPGEFNHAFIKMTVSGSDQNWVQLTYSDLEPYVDVAKLGGIYRPLWFFRNKWFINVLSHTLSWIGFFIGINFAVRFFRKEGRLTQAEALKNILAETDIATKLDIYVNQMLAPDKIPWWEPILVISVGALTFAVIFIGGMTLLPKLTPNSSIAIGLSDRRAQRYLNSFKFVIFGILISGLLIPLLVEIIKRLL